MNKLVENPKDLSTVRDVFNGLVKDMEKFDVDMFLHISDLFEHSGSEILETAKIVCFHCGQNSIPN